MSNELNKLLETIATQLETDLRLGGPWLPVGALDIKRPPLHMTAADTTDGRGVAINSRAHQVASPMRGNGVSQGNHQVAMAQLAKVAEAICACQLCPLHKSRKQAVPGSGNGNARIVFIGGAPTEIEQTEGLPLVGPEGELFEKIIGAMGLARSDVFLTNVLKCHLANTLQASPQMLTSCKGHLGAQLASIQPDIVVALGEDAAQYLLSSNDTVDKLRGRVHMYQATANSAAIKSIVTYHPSYLLKNYTIEIRKRMWEDMQRVMAAVGITPPSRS